MTTYSLVGSFAIWHLGAAVAWIPQRKSSEACSTAMCHVDSMLTAKQKMKPRILGLEWITGETVSRDIQYLGVYGGIRFDVEWSRNTRYLFCKRD